MLLSTEVLSPESQEVSFMCSFLKANISLISKYYQCHLHKTARIHLPLVIFIATTLIQTITIQP